MVPNTSLKNYQLLGTLPGTVLKEGEVRNGSNIVAVVKGVTSGEIQVRAEGLVVATCGGDNLSQGDRLCLGAEKLAMGVSEIGGVLINGGEDSGIPLAITNVAQNITLHVVCPYYNAVRFGTKAVVNSYRTRKDVLTVMPVVVVFPGKVGALDELVSCLGWIKSLSQQRATPPTLWAHSYWWDVLELLYKKGAVQDYVWQQIQVFNDTSEIVRSLK